MKKRKKKQFNPNTDKIANVDYDTAISIDIIYCVKILKIIWK